MYKQVFIYHPPLLVFSQLISYGFAHYQLLLY